MIRRRTAAALFALVVVTIPSSRAQADDEDPNALVERGAALYEAGDYAGAAQVLEAAQARLGNPRLLFNIARAYERAGNDERAVAFYRRYLDEKGAEPALAERARAALARLAPTPAPAAPPPATRPTTAPPPATADRSPATPYRAGAAPSHLASTILFGASIACAVGGLGIGWWASTTASDARASVDPTDKPELRDAARGRALAADLLLGTAVLAAGSGLFVRLVVEAPSSEGRARLGAASSGSAPRFVGLAASGTLGR